MASEVIGTIVETAQGIFCIDPADQFVSKALLDHGSYGQDEIARVSGFLTPQSRLLVVGAHIGSLLVPLSKRVAATVGIEANPRTYKRLQMNALMNRCDNLRLFNIAASDTDAPIRFVMNTTNGGASKRMPLVRNPVYFSDQPDIITVPGRRLDDLLPEESFDVIFMDIEGSELLAMRGMPRLLSAARVVFAEFYPFMVREVAGGTVDDFLRPLEAFETLAIPSLRKAVYRDEFKPTLQAMFDADQCDNGIIFLRDRVRLEFRG